MTKEKLIEFIENHYESGEQLLWQINSREDVASNADKIISPELWDSFVEEQDYYGGLAENFSEQAVDSFNEFVEKVGR